MSNIGIMDPAFFVGKVALLKWLNEFFEAGYTKVEQTATGAMHCQILDAIFPGKVALGKVNFDAKNEYEFVSNFKVLQSVFDSQQITKHVDVSKLVKAKFQDNLEMLQWMKHYFDTNYAGQPYNAKERREEARAAYKRQHKHAGTGLKRPIEAAPASSSSSDENKAPTPVKPAPAPKAAPAAKPAAAAAAPKPAAAKAAPAAAKPARSAAAAAPKATGAKSADAAALTEQLGKLTLTIEGLEKERNFYYGKLREIEILSQEDENADAATLNPAVEAFKKSVLGILYATDENAEFQVPDEAAAGAEAGNEEGLLGSDELPAE